MRQYLALTGEVEAAALKRAALRGLKELRLERAILSYLEDRDSAASADIAGLPRAGLLQLLIDKGVTLLDAPSTIPVELEALAARLGDERLASAATSLADTSA
ncbi:MAG: hypothetical protein HYY05_03880 [Chloroflexi bacterium]|nr:hypothetical protein [Chloroflexota bacterium]